MSRDLITLYGAPYSVYVRSVRLTRRKGRALSPPVRRYLCPRRAARRPPETPFFRPYPGLPAGQNFNEEVISRALPRAALCLGALESIMGSTPFLTGAALTLADLHAVSMFAYFIMTPEAQSLLKPHPILLSWWNRISARPSVTTTAYS